MMKKRLLSLVLTLCMSASILAPVSASTTETTPELSTTTSSVTTEESTLFETAQFKENMEFLTLLNTDRIKNGMTPLSVSPELLQASQIRAKELETLNDEKRPDGRYWYTILGETNVIPTETLNAIIYFGISEYYAYEIPGGGAEDVDEIYDAFMDKKSAILRRANITHMGLGHTPGKTTIKGKEYTNAWDLILIDKYTPVSIEAIHVPTEELPNGTDVDDMGIILRLKSISPEGNEYISYLPLLESMCSGYNKEKGGDQTVTVKYDSALLDLDSSETTKKSLSTTISFKTEKLIIPSTPTKVKAAGIAYNKVKVVWAPADDALEYRIFRSEKKASGYKLIATLQAEDLTLNDDGLYTYTDTNSKNNKLTCGKIYYYKVRARHGNGKSDFSKVDDAKPNITGPTKLTATSVKKKKITIKWPAVSKATSYRVYYSKKANGTYTRATNKSTKKTSFTITKLKKNTTYYVKVLSYRGSYAGKYSPIIKVKTAKK